MELAHYVLAGILLTTHPITSQSTIVIPRSAAGADAPAQSRYPFSDAPTSSFRFAQVIDGAEVCNRDATLTGLAFRRDAGNNRAYTRRRVPWMGVLASHARTTPMSMSTQFTQNWGDPQAIVFSAPYDLPAQPPVATVGPWNVAIPFNQPFSYARASGDLLFEISNYNPMPSGFYELDGFAVAHGATATRFGTGGSTSLGERYVLDLRDSNELRPGGRPSLRFTNFSRPYSAAMGLGVSNQLNGGLVLPFDLSALGAPGNLLYHSWDVPFLFNVRDTGIRGIHEGAVDFTVPDHPGMIGARLYAQAIAFDGAANSLGAVFSERLDLQFAQLVGPFQSIAAYGTITGRYLVDRTVLAGPVLQLTGTFN